LAVANPLHVEKGLVKATHCCPFLINPVTSLTSLVHVRLESIVSGHAPIPARHCMWVHVSNIEKKIYSQKYLYKSDNYLCISTEMIVNSIRLTRCWIYPGYCGVSFNHQNTGATTTQTKPHVLVGAAGNDRNSVANAKDDHTGQTIMCHKKWGEDKLISKKMMPLSGNNSAAKPQKHEQRFTKIAW